MSQHATDQHTDMPEIRRVTVEEAAKILGLSGNAVRKRLERGTLKGEKVDDVRYVLLNGDKPYGMPRHAERDAAGMPNDMPGDIALMQAHLDSMSKQVDYLKTVIVTRDEEIRRKDHLLAAALERIPAIEAASEPPGEPVSHSDNGSNGDAPPEQERRSWWRRLFEG